MEEKNIQEMREQIAILKSKINNQTLVNDRMMRHVVSNKTDSMKQKMLISIICAILVIIISPVTFHYNLGISWAFVIVTDIFMLYCIYREYTFKQMINNRSLMNMPMLEVAKTMSKFKSGYKKYTISNAFLLIPWFGWLVYEFYKLNFTNTHLFVGFLTAMAIGLLIGICIGLYMFFRIINSADDIIRQIEEE